MQEQTQHYELMVIISGSIAEPEHPQILEQIKNLLEQNGAKITKTLDLGRKKFAYAIKHLRHGFYFIWEFDLLPAELKKLEGAIKLNNNVLRFLTIKKKARTAADSAREEKIKSSRARVQLKKEQDEMEKIAAAKPKPVKTKVSLEDLDKKLDELLDEKII
ncbi:MAG: 30S ribosomal protein S6 [Candidatus Komeilibacteria bacterium]|nr:30S ribosomal protein S6 [Candidatus Komeilibacteria bacterium]